MTHEDCRQLDDFLAGDLPAAKKDAFLAHLDHCPDCRKQVQEQELLFLRLRRAVTELEPLPKKLVEKVRGRIQQRKRRWAMATVAAAAVLVALGAWWFTHEPRGVAPSLIVGREPVQADPRPAAHVAFQSEVLVVPVQSRRTNMTIIWVYPAVRSAGRIGVEPPGPHGILERNGS